MIKQKGQAAVEFAFIVPIVMFIVLGGIYGGILFIDYMNYSNLARQLARDATVRNVEDIKKPALNEDAAILYRPELYIVPKDKLDQFLKDAKEKDIKIQDMTKNELRDIIKGWKQNNIPQKPKEKFSVRLSIAEEDRTRFTEFLQGLFNRRDLSDDSLKSVEAAIKSLTMANTAKVGDTESGVAE